MRQTTLARPVEMVGTTLHKALRVRVRLEPLGAGSGIVFYRSDKAKSIPAHPDFVVDTKLATVLGQGGVMVSTIEHLLSALCAYGVDNARVVLDGDELPIMDGSAAAFCLLLEEAGLKEQEAPKSFLVVEKPIEVRDPKNPEKFVRLSPAATCTFSFQIRFPHPSIGEQHLRFALTREAFVRDIAPARTFGFLREVEYLRSIGLAQGGSLENAIVLDEARILNEGGLKWPDEFVRHKVLDAVGDMKLLGMPFVGHYEAFAGSHHLNHLLTKALLADAKAYAIVQAGQLPAVERVFAMANARANP